MAAKAVFVDRDNTLIEDPGYLADPSALRLLPGAELAVKSFMQAGYKVVVVTNQSGVARGILTEETLGKIHDRLRALLEGKGAHLDAIYYCPFHPEGSVEEYALDSDLRKPKPGMLLQAAEEMDLDLAESWMIGDSARDIDAGQRAGTKTIRVRKPKPDLPGEVADENVTADFTVRNIVEAARIILRHSPPRHPGPQVIKDKSASATHGDQIVLEEAMADNPLVDSASTTIAGRALPQHQPEGRDMREATAFGQPNPAPLPTRPETAPAKPFAVGKLIAGVVQMLTILAVLIALFQGLGKHDVTLGQYWATLAAIGQIMALTFFVMQRDN